MKRPRHPWLVFALVTALGGACIVAWYFYPSHADTVCRSVCSKLGRFAVDRAIRNVESQGGCELLQLDMCDDECRAETKQHDYPLLNAMLLHCSWSSISRQFAAAAAHLDPTAHLQNKNQELMPFLHLTDCQCDIKREERHFLYRMPCRLASHIVSHICGSFVLCFLCKVVMEQIWLLALNRFFGISKRDILAVQSTQVPVMDERGTQRCITLKGGESTIAPSLKVQSPGDQSVHLALDKFSHSKMKRLCHEIKNRCVDLDAIPIDKAHEAARRLDTLVGNWKYARSSFIWCTHLLQMTIAVVCHVLCVMYDPNSSS